jgi:hypothetical protein
MNVLVEAAEALYAALAAVDEVRLHRGIGAVINPPATALGPPEIEWTAYSAEPTGATFQVALIVAKAPDAMDELFRLLPGVVEALHGVADAAVRSPAKPGTWPSGGVDLPAYLIDVDYAL